MEDKNLTYRIPQDFNPYITMDAIRGLADAIHHSLLEGPGTQARMPYGDKAALNALVELLQVHVHELHDYFAELENRTSLDLPRSQEELDALDFRNKDKVREPAAIYSIR